MKKIDVRITIDQKWPVYDVEIRENAILSNCQIPESLFQEYLRSKTEYNRVQKILKDIYDKV